MVANLFELRRQVYQLVAVLFDPIMESHFIEIRSSVVLELGLDISALVFH